MAAIPTLRLRDGSGYTTNLIFTTNTSKVMLDGQIDTSTVAVQVSINGAPFVSDPDLVGLDGTTFRFPSQIAYPDGFDLELGDTTFQFRAIDVLGGVSGPGSVSVSRVPELTSLEPLIPTGIKVVRKRNFIDILISKPGSLSTNTELLGYNVYASKDPGGTSGYFRINKNKVETASTTYDELVQTVDTGSVIAAPQGSQLRLTLTQEDSFETPLATVVNKVIPTDSLTLNQSIKFTHTVQGRELREYVFFRHPRQGSFETINTDLFADVDATAPLYYVVTAIVFDSLSGSELETPYSQEVVGQPLIIDTRPKELIRRKAREVALSFVSAIQRLDSELSLISGSFQRDVVIDPFAAEVERLWYLADFINVSSSFATLLPYDDADGDRVSDPVATSATKQALKQALGLSSDQAVQRLIDTQFDKLSNNLQRPRLPGQPSVGQAVFYSQTRPTRDFIVPSGYVIQADADTENNLPASRYVVGGTYVLPSADAQAFYNYNTQRYEITVDIVAESAGPEANRPAGAIKTGGTGGFKVTNTESTVNGKDRESNTELAERSQLAYVSVDSGTEGGYQAKSAAQQGVVKSKIVKSGDSLMMRDYDDVRHKHIGGKVDIWIQGLRERTITETFAFTFEVARDIRCQVINVSTLTFRVLDSRVTPSTPIVEILNNLPQGFGVRNATTGQNYDLTGVILVDFQTFRLNTAIPQPVTAFDDVVYADYRFRSVNKFFGTKQPMRRVISVVGQSSGALTQAGFNLFKTEDPLLNGESTIAQDYVQITQVGGIPTGASITVNDEELALIGFFETSLKSIGINTATIRVFNEARTVEYDGPGTVAPDYEVIEGTATVPAKIKRTTTSTIVSGEPLSVDYSHDENFTVTYVVNDLLQQLHNTIQTTRHITADVVIKQAIDNAVSYETTVKLKRGAKKDNVDPAARTNLSQELNQKLIGAGSAQSDLVRAVDKTPGVDYQVIPIAKMGYVDGARKLREPVSSTSQRLNTLDIGGNLVYILTSNLQYPTTDGGGLATEHHGVFQDDEPFTNAASLLTVGQSARSAWINGAAGVSIDGYSDDLTLQADGFVDPEDLAAERLRRTANTVVISISGAGLPPDNPENHNYTVSYVVRGDRGPHDMVASEVEYLSLGDVALTFVDG